MDTITTTATATTPAPGAVRWQTIHFPQPEAWQAFRRVEAVQSCNPHLWRRWARAAALFSEGAVSRIGSTAWRVGSQSTAGESYAVVFPATSDVQAVVCECGDAVWRNVVWCKHALACFITDHAEQRLPHTDAATVA